MNVKILTLSAIIALSPMNDALAELEPDYSADSNIVTMPWYADVTTESKKVDLDFIKAMRPHHAGALTMSNDYLNDPGAQNKAFQRYTKGIIHNQEFEIMMLDRVEENLKQTRQLPARVEVATIGLAQKKKFQRAPLPIITDEIGAEEVRFSKAMIIHHQGAVDMCKAYVDDTTTNNQYLKLLCVDIMRDQSREIAYMNDVITKYKGNPEDIKIDASMIHGMDGMMHQGGGKSQVHQQMKHSEHH